MTSLSRRALFRDFDGGELDMWMDDITTIKKKVPSDGNDDSDAESDSSGEELPIWIRGEQRWVSGVISSTTCYDIISILLKDEEARGKSVNEPDSYQITERWRGVEQPLDSQAAILDIWNAWGTAQPEVKISLRRIRDDRFQNRKKRCRSDSSTKSDRSAYKTVHPRRLHTLQTEKQPSNTEQLIKLVLAQGEVIRRQLRKLRHSEHQIGFLEEKAHKARVRKHGSNYLLETYLKGLSEAIDPSYEENPTTDRHSDSGVVTEGDSEQSNNNNKQSSSPETERLSPSSDELQKDIKDEDDDSTSSTLSESTIREQSELYEMISKLNKKLLKEEEHLVRLHANIKRQEKEVKPKSNDEDMGKTLNSLRVEMAKSACEMQHNEVVLEETMEKIISGRSRLESLHKDLLNEDREFEMLQTLLYTTRHKPKRHYEYYKGYSQQPAYNVVSTPHHNTKEILDTLV